MPLSRDSSKVKRHRLPLGGILVRADCQLRVETMLPWGVFGR
jgi:hypothetical protein